MSTDSVMNVHRLHHVTAVTGQELCVGRAGSSSVERGHRNFFRIEDGLIAEHWESVDWVRAYQSFGLLSEEVDDT